MYGITIFSSILILGVYNIIRCITGFKINTLTFFMESVLLIAFSMAWLVKGEGIKYLNDKLGMIWMSSLKNSQRELKNMLQMVQQT